MTRNPSLRCQVSPPVRASLAAVLGLVASIGLPQELAAGEVGFSSYITPFPANEHYRLYVFGDSLASGLAGSLATDLAAQSVEVVNKAEGTPGLSRSDGNEWDKVIAALPPTESYQIAVVVFGADDRGPIRLPKQRLEFGAPAWSQEYTRRIDAVIKVLRDRKTAVYWLGLPIMRAEPASAAAQALNAMFLERARLNGTKYIDSWDGFVDADGGYADTGPDLTGNIRQLRLPDGVHLTAIGSQKLANILEREIVRDLTDANRERDVSLAGDDSEQQNVRDETLPRTAGGGAEAVKQGGTTAKPGKSSRDVAADDGTVSFPETADASPGAVTIVRPAIAGAIISQILSSRDAKLPELGHTMPADLIGGYTVLSSVTTSADARQNLSQQLPLSENPFYKLLIRGDSLPARPGRTDDFDWPRAGSPTTADPPPPGANG